MIFILFVAPAVLAQQNAQPEDSGQEVLQAQATMASLFGRGTTMPIVPHMGGTIALPSFDSSGMEIDERSLSAAQRQGLETRDQRSEVRD